MPFIYGYERGSWCSLLKKSHSSSFWVPGFKRKPDRCPKWAPKHQFWRSGPCHSTWLGEITFIFGHLDRACNKFLGYVNFQGCTLESLVKNVVLVEFIESSDP